MKDLTRKILSLLCLVSLLSVAPGSVFGGGEHPWDSDNSTGVSGDATDIDGGSAGGAQPMLRGVAYIGPRGFFEFIGDYVWTYAIALTSVAPDKSTTTHTMTAAPRYSSGD